MAIVVVVVVAALAISLTALLVFQPILDLTAFKATFEAPLTAFMETPVTVERVLLKPGSWTLIEFMGVRVEGAGHGAGREFAIIDNLVLDLAVMPLLDNEVHLRQLKLEGVSTDVVIDEAGEGNWPVWTTFTYEIAELRHISITDAVISYVDDARVRQHQTRIERFSSDIGDSSPLKIELRAAVDTTPIEFDAVGPTWVQMKSGKPWPQTADLRYTGLEAKLDGTIGGTKEAPIFDMRFAVHSDEIGEVVAAAGGQAMKIGGLDLAGRVTFSDDTYRLLKLAGSLGSTAIDGSATLDFTGDIPALAGGFGLGHLDIRPWAEEGDSAAALKATDARGLDDLTSALAAFNAHLLVTIDRLSLPGADLDDLELALAVEDGVLSVPIDFRLGSSVIRGQLRIDDAEGRPRLALDLGTRHLDLGALAHHSIGGSVGRATLEAETRGATLDDLVDNLHFKISGDELAVAFHDSSGVDIGIPMKSIAVIQNPGSGIWATVRGRHREMPFTLEVATANLPSLLDGGTIPVRIIGTGGGATADIRGSVDATTGVPAVDLRYSIEGDAIGDLSPWIGIESGVALPFMVMGRLDTMHGRPRLAIGEARLGRSTLTADLSIEDDGRLTVARVDAPVIDLDELAALRSVTEALPAEDELSIHDQIIPTGLRLPDADLEISVGQIDFGGTSLADVSASLRSREGRLESSPFGLTFDERPVTGTLELDLRGASPEIDLFASTESIDGEDIANRLDLESAPRTSIGRIDLDLKLRGTTLDEIQFDSYASIVVQDLDTELSIPGSGDALQIELKQLQLDALFGQRTRIAATGRVNGAPVDLLAGFAMMDLETFAREGMPAHLVLRSGDTELDIEGLLIWPFDPNDLEMHVLLSGANLADINPLLGTDLPSIGPYSVDGRFTVEEGNFGLSDLYLVVGQSTFRGEVSFFEGHDRPIIVGRLASYRPRLEDFYPSAEDEGAAPSDLEPLSDESEGALVIDPELLLLVDADLSFDVTGFEWGDRGPGVGEFRLQLDDGSLTTTVFWDQPNGGYIDARLDVESDGEVVDAVLDADIDHMSYGPLGYLLSWESPEGGILSLDAALRGSGHSLEAILDSLEGHLDFTTYPEGHHAAAFNLWGGQLLDTLLPVFGAGKHTTKLNCTVGELDIADGRIVPRRLVVDASRTRVKGKGEIDYRNNRIQLKANPRPKRSGFISLATPVHIVGQLDNPDIRVDTGGLAVTVLRVSAFVVTVWAELFKKQLPIDGSDICVDPTPRTLELEASIRR